MASGSAILMSLWPWTRKETATTTSKYPTNELGLPQEDVFANEQEGVGLDYFQPSHIGSEISRILGQLDQRDTHDQNT
jgi:hypothetical protein